MRYIALISFDPNEAFFLSENLKDSGCGVITINGNYIPLELYEKSIELVVINNVNIGQKELVSLSKYLRRYKIMNIIITEFNVNLPLFQTRIKPGRTKLLLSLIWEKMQLLVTES